MRVGLLTSWVSQRGGGLFHVIHRLAPLLQTAPDLQVEVFGLIDGELPTADDWHGVPVTALPTYGPPAWGYAPGLAASLSDSDLDLLHIHGLWMYPSMACLRWARATARSYMIAPHGMLDGWAINNNRWRKRAALWAYEARHLRGAACLHALCESEASALRSFGLRNAICIVPNGVDPPDPAPACKSHQHSGVPEHENVLLYLGRLHPKKGLVNLLYAWRRFQCEVDSSKRGWHLAIAGWDENGHGRYLRQLANTLGLTGTVHFLGPQFGPSKSDLFRASAAFVLPSFSEGLPIAVLEAWSYGLPVLMTRHCNLPQGFRCNAALEIDTSSAGIAHGLATLAAMPDEQRRLMGRNGMRLCSEHFSQRQASESIAAVYRWLLQLGPKPACIVAD